MPGLAEARLILVKHDQAIVLFGGHTVGARVDDDRVHVRVDVGLAMEQQQAGLRGDRQFDLVREFEAAAAFEMFFGHEDAH